MESRGRLGCSKVAPLTGTEPLTLSGRAFEHMLSSRDGSTRLSRAPVHDAGSGDTLSRLVN
ncbi:hypothetical protein BJF80_05240 [Serinicoccus sp. CUA-874]|nr:hypothetical protein BJF80_05240 [Serinicoccus sp. CUA-874]